MDLDQTVFYSPCTGIIAGGTGTGKTEFTKKLVKFRSQLFDKVHSQVIYAYGEYNASTIVEFSKDPKITCLEGLPDLEMIKNMKKPGLVILDDLMLYFKAKEKYTDILYTRGSHHWGVDVFTITQNAFEPVLKTARNNSHYLILTRAPQQKLAIRNLGVQLFPGEVDYFQEAYKSATSSQFSYLLVDLHPKTSDNRLRLTTNIFPGEKRIAFVP